MFLLKDRADYIFFDRDPRMEGYSGPVEADVVLYEPLDVYHRPRGENRPEICTGVSLKNPKWFKVFPSEHQCREEGYKKVASGTPMVCKKWSDYVLRKIQQELMPEHANEYLAINLETGEYVLGKTSGEAFRAFLNRWPDKSMYKCRVDGGPSIKFRGR